MRKIRPKTNDRIINIRLPADLVSSVESVAAENGMSISTFTRQSLRRNVDFYQLYEGPLRADFSKGEGERKMGRKMMSFSEHAHWFAEQRERKENRVLRKLEDEQRAAWLSGGKRCKK